MKKIFLIITCVLFFTSYNLSQGKGWWWKHDGVSYLPETVAYQTRVLADGGEVIDINSVNAFYVMAKTNNLLDTLKLWWEPDMGFKKDANNKVTKFYDLTPNNNDFLAGSTGDTSSAMIFTTNVLNGKPSIYNAYGAGKVYFKTTGFFATGNHNDNATYFLLVKNVNTAGTKFYMEQRAATTANGLAIVAATNYGIYDASGSGYQYSTYAGNNTNPHLAILYVSSLTFNLFVDGSSRKTGSLTGVGNAKTSLRLGDTGGRWHHFCWGVAGNSMSLTKITALQNYLNIKYTIY